ncbi:MAG: virulence RhuM family protein [Trichloromonadaceae bacterium]
MKKTEEHGVSEVVLFQAEDGKTSIDVQLDHETVWLNLNQMSELFQRDKSFVSRHLRTIFQSEELNREATVAKNATVQTEEDRQVTRTIELDNLDVIIAIGYRVNSLRGTQFRQWATRIAEDLGEELAVE